MCTAADRAKLNSFINRCKRIGFCDKELPSITRVRSEENRGKKCQKSRETTEKVTKIAANSRQNHGIKFLSFLSLKYHLGL